jgi:cell division protein FtsI (penicillin-binding protein 3)
VSTTRRSPPSRRTARPDDDPATRAGEERGRGGSPRRAPGPTPRPARAATGRSTTGRGATRAGSATRKGPAAKKAVAKKAAGKAGTTTRARTTRGTTTAPRTTRSTRAGTAAPTRVTPDAATAVGVAGGRRRRGARPGWRDAGDPHRRAIALLALLVGLFAIVGLRLVMVQVVTADRYVRYGESQRGLEPIVLPAGRGAIFDRNGTELALSVVQRTIWADPRLITDPAAAARKLAPVLLADEAELRSRLERDAAFVYVARQVPDEVADAVDELDLDGIFSLEEPKRLNPAGDLARSVIGRTDVDNAGVSGLEAQYDGALTGEPGELVVERDRDGRTIPAGRHHVDPATPGEDLVLTIDRNLQAESERILLEQVAERGAKGGTAIVSDPETGKILALVNVVVDPDTGEVRLTGDNVAVTANYEPGSVNKVITMAAAIEEGLVVPETELDVPNQLQVADHTFTDSHDMPGRMSVAEILAQSSNVGTILVGQELGKDRLYDYLRDFGFGDSTALDFPAEVSGALPAPDDWSGTSIGTIPIGQGVAVTAMQMLLAYNAIANDGVYVPPKLVDQIIDADGERRPVPSARSHRVVSPTTAALVRQMMAGVVDEGTGEAAAIDGYEVAGKTGTARKPAPDRPGYRWEDGDLHYISTFAGFMPADDPKLSVIVVLDEPRSTYASTSAAPAFGELSRYALRLLRLPPPAGGTTAGQPTITLDSPLARGQAAPYPETTTTEPPTTTTTAPPLNGPLAGGPPLGGGTGGGRGSGGTTFRPVRTDPDRRG